MTPLMSWLTRLFSNTHTQRWVYIGTQRWVYIGNNRSTGQIPRWVINTFANEPGSHGTRLIDYPESGMVLRYNGKTFQYKIEMGERSWSVYKRKRRKKPLRKVKRPMRSPTNMGGNRDG
jgi:hypothetical protein